MDVLVELITTSKFVSGSDPVLQLVAVFQSPPPPTQETVAPMSVLGHNRQRTIPKSRIGMTRHFLEKIALTNRQWYGPCGVRPLARTTHVTSPHKYLFRSAIERTANPSPNRRFRLAPAITLTLEVRLCLDSTNWSLALLTQEPAQTKMPHFHCPIRLIESP